MNVDLLSRISLEIIAPVIIMAGIGFVLGWRRVLDPEPVAAIYLNVLAPAFAFVKIIDAGLTGPRVGQVFLFSLLSVGVLLLLALVASRMLGHDRGMRGAFANSVIMYNSANYGIPVQELAFKGLGGVIQPIVLLTQNFVGFTLGMFFAASNSPSAWATLKRILRMPLLWGIVAGAVARLLGVTPGGMQARTPVLWVPLDTFDAALVPVALLSLGVQLSRVRIHGKVLNISVGTALRLLAGPAVGLGVGLGLRWLGGVIDGGWLGALLDIDDRMFAVLVVSLSFPTAVFSSVLATEFRNHPEYAAATVFISTVISIVTVTAVIYLSRLHLAPAG